MTVNPAFFLSIVGNVEIKNLPKKRAILYLKGKIDVAVSSEIEEKFLDSLNKNENRFFVINMEQVEYISSSGFRVIIAILRHLRDNDGDLKLCCLSASVKKIFSVIELTSLFEVFDNETEAVESF